MSLIHDALRAVDADTPTTAPGAKPLTPPVGSNRVLVAAPGSGWWAAVGSFAVVVAAGGVAWWLWRGHGGAQLPSQPVTPPVATAPAVQPKPMGVTSPAPAVAEAAQPVAAMSASPASAPPVSAPPATAPAATGPAVVPQAMPEAARGPQPLAQAPAVVAPEPVAAVPEKSEKKPAPALTNKAKRAIKNVKTEAPPAPAMQEPVDDMPIEQRFARFTAALASDDVAQAQQELSLLRKRLPPQAVGLLRAQAWFDLKTRNTEAAIRGYRQVLERLPGDEEAALNLASLLSQADQPEQARDVLAQALTVRSDSVLLRNALRRFTPEARP